MRMHRGSSKGDGSHGLSPEALPLSASAEVEIVVELVRAGRSRQVVRSVPRGTRVRALLRELGEFAEGSAVLVDGRSIPLDSPLEVPVRLMVVPTFSGG